MRWTLLSFLLVIVQGIHAQNTTLIKGVVLDSISGEKVSGCLIQVKSRTNSVTTDINGRFQLSITSPPNQIHLVITCLGFEDKILQNINKSKFDSEIDLKISLQPRVYEIPGVVIPGERLPETVWGNEKYNVADFACLGKNILLLTYEQEERWKRQEESKITLLGGCALVLIDSNYQEITRLETSLICRHFYTNYFDDVFLVSRYERHHITIAENELYLSPISDEDFHSGVEPVIDSVGSMLFYSTYDASFPAFEYMSFNKADSTYHQVRYLIDEEIMAMFRSEYKYLHPRQKLEAFRYEVKHGIDKEIVAAYMSGFQNSPYYEPLNAPMIVANDTLLIFDHHHDKLLRFDGFGHALDSSKIDYHERRGEKWSGNVILDKINAEVYTTHLKGGYVHLSHIRKESGSVDETFKLHYKYVENIRVFDNMVYYIYRPFESSQKKFLYRERLRS
jgi:hypothetical protein